jgi:hypothetical protein
LLVLGLASGWERRRGEVWSVRDGVRGSGGEFEMAMDGRAGPGVDAHRGVLRLEVLRSGECVGTLLGKRV